MIISRGRGYIFVHIPKTGGTAMALALEDRAKADDIMIGDTPKAVKRRGKVKGIQTAGRLWKHSTLADAEGLITRDEMETLFTFTLVRNPWDRMVSSYAYKVHGTSEKQRSRNDSFEEFLHAEFKRKKKQQVEYLHDSDGKVDINFIGRFESLANDYQRLGEQLGIVLPALPVLNKSKGRGDYRDLYNDKTRQLVAKKYQDDIDLFEYTF